MIDSRYGEIIFQKTDGIAIAKLNRPQRRNAFTPRERVGLARIAEEVAEDDSIRVLVITGAGTSFCSGADVEALQERGKQSGPVGPSGRNALTELLGFPVLKLSRLRKPIIGAINGPVAGGGIGLALVCDIRIASESARFLPFWSKRGLVPDWGSSFFLPRLVGYSKAMELILASRPLDAREACSLGLFNKVVPDDQLWGATMELAQSCVAAPAVAVELAKANIQRGVIADLETMLEMETRAQDLCMRTEDFQEGLRSFFEKREPQFPSK